MNNQKFSINKRLKSFSFAFNGLKILFKEEHNSRIHFTVTLFVLIAGWIFSISMFDWIAIVLSIGIVISTELINSAIENLSDFVSPERNVLIKKVKDLAAASVLISAISSVVIGLIVFIPKITKLF